ncbi:MAG: hypothetical protein MI919_41765 [Holophagales bacterium]|nr:hypothetical protein [Holophagales bacterium]
MSSSSRERARNAVSASTDRRRSARRSLGAWLVLALLAAGGLGHGHGHCELFDEDPCAVCNLVSTAIVAPAALEAAQLANARGEARRFEPGAVDSIALRLSQPLRGPPLS